MQPRPALSELITYNVEIVGQALAIAHALEARHADFAAHAGPHLRHIVEHYEALLTGMSGSMVDYDHRSRDREVETDPALAATRLRAVIAGLERLRGSRATHSLSVGLDGGGGGEHFFVLGSTLGRELLFLASHAVHHFALLKPALREAGMITNRDFGKAPSTVRHERATLRR